MNFQLSSFIKFYKSLDPNSGIRGKQFEVFIKWFLTNEPIWQSIVKKVWLWDEHPNRSTWGPDCGIDLVFDDVLGRRWAVQAKCFSPELSIKKEDMDSFISESSDNRFQCRLLVASTNRIGTNADRILKRHKIIRYLLKDFQASNVIFPTSILDLSSGRKIKPKTPKSHQKEAISKVVESLKTNDKGQVLMACGTGKTLTMLWIKEQLKVESCLVIVPSLNLLSQILKEWKESSNINFKWICVCSDKSVANQYETQDEWINNSSELCIPVTNKPDEIKQFLFQNGPKVIFSTYQSTPIISTVLIEQKSFTFDLVFADEAHRCAGKVSESFGCVLDENKIRAKKRLFFTSTPRVLSSNLKSSAKVHDIKIASMDDHSIFGDVMYQLKFSEAIKNKLLSDYQVVVIGVNDKLINEQIQKRDLLTIDYKDIYDAETLAAHIALLKAVEKYNLKKIITFHSRVNNAKKFAQNFLEIVNTIPTKSSLNKKISCDHVSGLMPTSERNEKIQSIKDLPDNEIKIITNARCLSEGVDVPSLNGIAFIDPKSSQIDIIQAVGRAIRKSDDKSKGTIIIPVYLEKIENAEDEILASKFKTVWEVILALKSQDDSLMEILDEGRISLGNKKFGKKKNLIPPNIIFDFPEVISEKFINSINTLLIENTSSDWLQKYGELQEYYAINNTIIITGNQTLRAWCNTQRILFKKGNLSKERELKLKNIPGWTFEILEDQWHENYYKLLEFDRVNNHLKLPARSKLNDWAVRQRKEFHLGNLSKERENKLKVIPHWSFNPEEDQWDALFQELIDFQKKNGHIKPSYKTKLGIKVHELRASFQRGQMPPSKINDLKSIEGWSFNPLEDEWVSYYEELKIYVSRFGHARPPRKLKLGIWVANQRKLFNQGKLSKERESKLREIKHWTFNPLEDQWNKKYQELISFVRENNHARPPEKHELSDWVYLQRKLFKQNKLPKHREILLRKIKGWTFDTQ